MDAVIKPRGMVRPLVTAYSEKTMAADESMENKRKDTGLYKWGVKG
jgi:hypothetical protein